VRFISLASAAALAVATQSPAFAEAQGFAQIGPSDYGYYNDGTGIKLGADFAPNLRGIKGLGLTAFYAHTEGDDRYSGRYWNHDANTVAFGPTYTYAFPGTRFSVQGRAFVELDWVRWDSPCCRHSSTDLDVGIGLGAQFALDNKFAIRLDYDMLGVGADLLSIGLGFKF
jgi:hypothetical protein